MKMFFLIPFFLLPKVIHASQSLRGEDQLLLGLIKDMENIKDVVRDQAEEIVNLEDMIRGLQSQIDSQQRRLQVVNDCVPQLDSAGEFCVFNATNTPFAFENPVEFRSIAEFQDVVEFHDRVDLHYDVFFGNTSEVHFENLVSFEGPPYIPPESGSKDEGPIGGVYAVEFLTDVKFEGNVAIVGPDDDKDDKHRRRGLGHSSDDEDNIKFTITGDVEVDFFTNIDVQMGSLFWITEDIHIGIEHEDEDRHDDDSKASKDEEMPKIVLEDGPLVISDNDNEFGLVVEQLLEARGNIAVTSRIGGSEPGSTTILDCSNSVNEFAPACSPFW